MTRVTCLPLVVLCTTLCADEVDFNRDVRPILAAKCFACHGPDEEQRQAELRLDFAADDEIVAPGKPDDSELIRRIFSDEPDEQMPPPDANERLSDDQRQALRQWVAAGAKYDVHWAFVPPSRPDPPAIGEDRAKNDIDRFVAARLRTEGLRASPAADAYTLVRRVYLDLIGLPPTPAEADRWVEQLGSPISDAAYSQLVDHLLASEQYGERWARLWLDLARYSDTNGYEKDRPRSVWPYRDWVIRALNDDMPFDQFTIEQLAGDMLPDATISQRVATGFHRNTMLNEEGGIDPLEFRFYAMVDRVATTGTVWLGLTTGCAQCHSHKYDPISHTDYYGLMALLNNADEPDLAVPQAELLARRESLLNQITELEAKLADQFPVPEGEAPEAQRRREHLDNAFQAWVAEQRKQAVDWTVLRATRLESNLPKLEQLDDGSIFSSGDVTKRDVFRLQLSLDGVPGPITGLRLEALSDERLPAGGPGRAFYEGRKGDFFLSELSARVSDQPVAFASGSHSYGKISIGSGTADAKNVFDGEGSTGWSTANREGEPHQLVLQLQQPLDAAGELTVEMIFERHFAASLGRFRIAATTAANPRATQLPVAVEGVLVKPSEDWSADEYNLAMRHFLRVTPELAKPNKQIDDLRTRLPKPPITLVLAERPADNPRKTFRHHRGEYLSHREEVAPALPALFSSTEQPVTNRLQLAQWLVSNDNPLVARVTVNRAWRAFFGAGLLRTSGDFGTQSAAPSHPKLLDWLASEFMDDGWSLKRLHRLIVTSATYRQSSRVTPELLARDRGNVLLARGPRHRVAAETVRDMMLKASGKLSSKMYGPSVYPPQPAGVTALAYGSMKWTPSAGEDRYRRSLYTFSKRTAPFAAYTTFDGPTGEGCVARRDRSNTPLQALTLLNDAMFFELARATVATVGQDEATDANIAQGIFRRFLTRPATDRELAAILDYHSDQQTRLTAGDLDIAAIAGGKEASATDAAWVMVARAVMNLDEAITKQ